VPSSQQNQLIEFCKKGSTQQLLDALAIAENPNTVDERGNSLLCIALKNGHWGTYTALVNNDYINPSEKLALISACQCRRDDSQGILLVLARFPDIDVQNRLKRTALMTACLLGHFKKSQELINKGASCEMQDEQGNNALIEAVQSNNKKIVELVLSKVRQIDQVNKRGETALIVAIKQKNPIEDIIKLLLTAQADPEKQDANNKSTWLIAKQKHPKISRLIEKHLNSINQIELPFFSTTETTTQAQEPPLKDTEASDSNMQNSKNLPKDSTTEIAEIKTTVDEKPILTESKTVLFKKKITHSNKQEWFHAAKIGNLGGLNRMILAEIDINCTDNKGCTALIRACGHSRRAVVSFLLQQNADIEIRSDNGSTAMSSSIIGNCRRVAGLLLENNADPNGLGPSDYSYATIAAAQWNDAMLSILYRHGADIFINNKQQQNLLHIVAQAAEFYNNINNAKNTMAFLMDHSIDVNSQDAEGNTALMILCGAHKNKYVVDDRSIASIVHNILKLGAAAAMTNNAGKSALDAAQFHKLPQTKGIIMNALSWNTI
jgi:ankyrin repeat protein